MRPLSEHQRRIIVELCKQGHSIREISKKTGVSRTSVHRVKSSLTIHLPPVKMGRPKMISEAGKRFIIREITTGRQDTASGLVPELSLRLGKNISAQTIRNTLKSEGLKSAVKRKKPLLSQKHRNQRLKFAEKYKSWTVEDWKRVVWSDEAKINRIGSDGRKWCWKKTGEQLSERVVSPTIKFGGGSIMVWGCFTAQGIGNLVRIDGGLDAQLYKTILEEDLLGTMQYYNLDVSNVIFQHDNDPKHKAKLTTSWLEDNEIQVLDWPAQSPDLNPIEHIWGHLKRSLQKYKEPADSIQTLWNRVESCWNEITTETCLNLIDSMPQRLKAVIQARGGYTKY